MNRTILRVGRVLVLSALAVTVAEAQVTSTSGARSSAPDIPKEYVPPAGMCRIWLDAVPAAQQPAPTECSIAVRNKPPNGKVVYGPKKGAGSAKDVGKLPIKRFDNKVGTGIPPVSGVSIPAGANREPWENKRISDSELFGNQQGSVPLAASAGLNGLSGGAGGFDAYVGQGGLLLGAGQINDPRYFSGNAPPPGRGSTNCLDRDGDGWCDDFRFGPPPCLDRDEDGRCDDLPAFAALPYPQVLPQMQAAVDVVQGRQSVEVAQWLGTNEFIARLPDQGRGTPWRAIFLDANSNQLLQVWTDRDKDGRVDRVEVFRNGERVKLIQR